MKTPKLPVRGPERLLQRCCRWRGGVKAWLLEGLYQHLTLTDTLEVINLGLGEGLPVVSALSSVPAVLSVVFFTRVVLQSLLLKLTEVDRQQQWGRGRENSPSEYFLI